jgi:hypothetical protein
MACPYFYPVARFETDPWIVPPRLPLGDAFSGECRAPGNSRQPDETRMREVCNFGYGRHGCDQFPAQAAADAIRFHITEEKSELIRIHYVFEKDCWPGEHGEVDLAGASPTLVRQAGAVLESYMRRRSEA